MTGGAGTHDWSDRLAAELSRFRDNRRWLSSPDRLRIAHHVDLSRPHRFIEIGPSTGWRTLAALVALGNDVTAVDLWSHYPVWNRLAGDVHFAVQDGHSLPVDDASYDHCVFTAALSYFDEPERALADIHRALRADGLLFISCNRRESAAYRLGLCDPIMKTFWDVDELEDRLQHCGFEPLESYRWGHYPWSTRIPSINPWLGRLEKLIDLTWLTQRIGRDRDTQESFACCVAKRR